LISVSQVARIIGVSYPCLASSQFWWIPFCCLKICVQDPVLYGLPFAWYFIFKPTHLSWLLQLSPLPKCLGHHHFSSKLVISTWISSSSVYKSKLINCPWKPPLLSCSLLCFRHFVCI
jgi:hypothetical protein